MTERERVLEFLRAFVNGGVNQDFRNWAEGLYRDMRTADAATATHRCIYYPDCAVCGHESGCDHRYGVVCGGRWTCCREEVIPGA